MSVKSNITKNNKKLLSSFKDKNQSGNFIMWREVHIIYINGVINSIHWKLKIEICN